MSISKLLVAAALVALGCTATPASASEKKTIPATIVFQHGAKPTDPGNCSAVAFVQWPASTDRKDAVSWQIKYRYSQSSTQPGREFSDVAKPPFNDVYTWVRDYAAPPGVHWHALPPSWSDGPKPNDCSEASAKQSATLDHSATVVMTYVVDKAACKAARKKATAARKAVTRLQARVARAQGAEKARLKRALTAAKKTRAKAVGAVAGVC